MLLALLACTPPHSDSTDSACLTAACADSTDSSDSAAIDPRLPTRGMWVWDTDVAGDAAATAELLSFSADHQVTTLFLNCDPVGYGLDGAEADFVSFVGAAHNAGLEVYAMTGYSWFSVPCDADLPGQPTCWTEGWSVYEACVNSSVPFDGVMDDTEPASTPDGSWSTDYAQRAAWHLEYLRGIRARIGDLPFHHAIPAWYDARELLELDQSGTRATLDVWIAGVVDVVGLMSYRDNAADILDLAANELHNGPVWIGTETAPSTEGEHITFAEEGSTAMEAAFDQMTEEVGEDPNLYGFMVHAYETWKDLPE